MRKLIFAICGLIVALGSPALAVSRIEITGLSDEGKPCALRAVVNEDRVIEHLVISAEEREVYNGNFMTVEPTVVGSEPLKYSAEELEKFQFIPEMRNGKRNGALVRGLVRRDVTPDETENDVETRRVRLRIYESGTKRFSFSERSNGTKFTNETLLFCTSQPDVATRN